MAPWMLVALSLALAEDPVVPSLGFRVDEQAGWRHEGEALVGASGVRVGLRVEPAGEARPELEVADIEVEKAALEAELRARKLSPVEVEGRIVTTPLGEPEVLLSYGLKKARGYKGEPPPARGLRVTRRCGPTVRLSLEGEAPAQSALLEAAAQLLWADPACHRWNPRPYHQVETEAAGAGPAFREAPPPAPAPERSPLGAILALLAVFGFGGAALLVWRRRAAARAPQARPAAPRPARATGQPAPPPLLIPEEGAAPAPAAPAPAAPRPLGALGAKEGVWVTPVASPPAEDPLQAALQRLGAAVGLDRAPPPAAALPELPPTWRALLELHDGASFGGGWLRLLGAWEGRGLTVQVLNEQLQGKVGRRHVVGFFANGALVLVGARGEILVASPGDHMPRRLAANPTAFLGALAEDAALRAELCSPGDLQLSLRQLGSLGPDQVIVTEGGEQQKRSVLSVWERAPALL